MLSLEWFLHRAYIMIQCRIPIESDLTDLGTAEKLATLSIILPYRYRRALDETLQNSDITHWGSSSCEQSRVAQNLPVQRFLLVGSTCLTYSLVLLKSSILQELDVQANSRCANTLSSMQFLKHFMYISFRVHVLIIFETTVPSTGFWQSYTATSTIYRSEYDIHCSHYWIHCSDYYIHYSRYYIHCSQY